jgi:hypothetical protein
VATVIENLEDLSVDEVIEQFDVTRSEPRVPVFSSNPSISIHRARWRPHRS